MLADRDVLGWKDFGHGMLLHYQIFLQHLLCLPFQHLHQSSDLFQYVEVPEGCRKAVVLPATTTCNVSGHHHEVDVWVR